MSISLRLLSAWRQCARIAVWGGSSGPEFSLEFGLSVRYIRARGAWGVGVVGV
jgi:hypothetical protein